MSLVFYCAPISTASITEAVLAELGASCERVQLDIDAGDTRRPDFPQANPNGRVPAIVHEGTPIRESSAITMYLGEAFGVDAGLYPEPGPKRGDEVDRLGQRNAGRGGGSIVRGPAAAGHRGRGPVRLGGLRPPRAAQRERAGEGTRRCSRLSRHPRRRPGRATVSARRVQPRGHAPPSRRWLDRVNGGRSATVPQPDGVDEALQRASVRG